MTAATTVLVQTGARADARRDARSTLAVLVLLFFVLQVASVPVADHYLQQPTSDAATYLQWHGYLARSAPDILVLGDSRADTDIDPGVLSSELGASSYRFGIPGETPLFLRELLQRVLARPARPRAVILTLSEFQFNAGYGSDPTDDLVQLMSPFDPGFAAQALRADPYPDRLLISTALPAVANYRLISLGVQADLAHATSPRPVSPATPPAVAPTAVPDSAPVLAEYRGLFLANYRWSEPEQAALEGMVSDLRSAHIPVLLLIPPVNGIDEINPALYQDFVARSHSIADRLGVPLADEHDSALKRDPAMWRDPSHLDEDGARSLTTRILPLVPLPAPSSSKPGARGGKAASSTT